MRKLDGGTYRLETFELTAERHDVLFQNARLSVAQPLIVDPHSVTPSVAPRRDVHTHRDRIATLHNVYHLALRGNCHPAIDVRGARQFFIENFTDPDRHPR